MAKTKIINISDLSEQFDNFEDIFKKDGDEIEMLNAILLKFGYDLTVPVERSAICMDGIGKFINGTYVDKVSGNFKWWDVDSGKLIIVTDAVMPIANLLRHLSREKRRPEKVIYLDILYNENKLF